MKYTGKIHIVFDGMWGYCGKGKFCGELALDSKLDIKVCVNNNAPNAGHTFVFDDGRKIMTKHIPIGFVNQDIPYLVIGENAILDYDILVYELYKYKDILNGRQIYIADTAAVILPEHKLRERREIKSGSTFSGAGAALADKIMRKNPLVCGDERFKRLEKLGLIKIVPPKTFFPSVYNGLGQFEGNENILVELSQGDALGINNGSNYPNTTFRDCTPAQALKDIHAAGQGFKVVKYCVFRPYPIRISNNSDEGYIYTGDFEGANEITWQEVCKRCGLSVEEVERLEHSTVTNRIRRVSEFCVKQFAQMLLDTHPDQCFLNFAQYINGNIKDISTRDAKTIQKSFMKPYDLSEQGFTSICEKNFALENVLGYIESMENYFNNELFFDKLLNITKIGTGAALSKTIERQAIFQVADTRHAIKNVNPLDFAAKNNDFDFEV